MSSNVLLFPDRLTGRRVSLALVADGKLRTPAELRAQIKRPLELIKASARIFAQLSPFCKDHRQEGLPPLGFMSAEYSVFLPVRVMCGCVPSTGHRACRCARDVQDDGALGCVDNGACDVGSRAERAGAAAAARVLCCALRLWYQCLRALCV